MKSTIKIILGLVVSGGCLYYVLKDFDFNSLKMAIRSASWGWFVPALILIVTAYFLRVCRWRSILNSLTNYQYWELFPVLTFGFFVNTVLPARAGEFARAIIVTKEKKIGFPSVFGTLIVERLSDLCFLLILIAISVSLLRKDSIPLNQFLALLSVIILGALFVFFIHHKLMGADRSRWPAWAKKLFHLFDNLELGLRLLKSPKKFLNVFMWSCLVWLSEIISALLLSYAFHLNLHFQQAAALFLGISLGVMIPAAPGYIGTYELFGQKILILLGFNSDLALSFVLLLHFFQLSVVVLLGMPYLFKVGLNPAKQLTNSSRFST